eukprot:1876760-Amphidinium_carterae.1
MECLAAMCVPGIHSCQLSLAGVAVGPDQRSCCMNTGFQDKRRGQTLTFAEFVPGMSHSFPAFMNLKMFVPFLVPPSRG